MIRALVSLAVLAAACGAGDDRATVTAADYRFDNLPAVVKVGTTLDLTNASVTELHEMLVARLPDSEQRPVEALAKLPASQFDALLAGATVTVLVRGPGRAELIRALGDGKLTERGRYLVVCTIPVGVDPTAFLAATRGRTDAPLPVGGPAHYVLGMYGEIRVQ